MDPFGVWQDPRMFPHLIQLGMMEAHYLACRGGLAFSAKERRGRPACDEMERRDLAGLKGHLLKPCSTVTGVCCGPDCMWDEHRMYSWPSMN